MNLSIVMYHYVREIKASAFPDIKGLEFKDFQEQILFFEKYYNIIKMEDLLAYYQEGHKLPERSLLLTFDDGYTDHFRYVLPFLMERKLQGSFYIPSEIIQDKKVLDVNIIHFTLASCSDKEPLVQIIFKELAEYKKNHSYPESDEDLYKRISKEGNRYDPPEIKFIKQCLQRVLPEKLRRKILLRFVNEILKMDESEFSQELYISKDQIFALKKEGMHVGGHGHTHKWFDSISKKQKELEFKQMISFMDEFVIPKKERTICYPYGSYDKETLKLAKDYGFQIGVTTKADLADLNQYGPLTLPRLDTNDYPKSREAAPNQWYHI